MDDGRWAILFDQEYIRAEDYKRCLQTVNDFNFFIDELPDLLRKDTLVELNQCSNCQKISLPQRTQDEDMQPCYRQRYSHKIERVASVDGLRDTKLDIMTLRSLFELVGMDFEEFNKSANYFFELYNKVYICRKCDTISSLPEHAGYRSSNHKHSYTLTSLDQLKGIKFDLLHFFDILKNCVDSLRPEILSHKWDIHFEPVSLGKRLFYSGNFGNTDWKEYIKIDEFHKSHEALEIYTRFLETLPKKLYNWALYKCLDCNSISSNSRIIGPCWQTNNWFDENHYLPQMPHKFEKIENVDVFLNSKVSLNILGKAYAQRNNLKSKHLHNFLQGILGFPYFVKHCEMYVCIQCGNLSIMKQGSLCRSPYHKHVFNRIIDVFPFYDEPINLFEFQNILRTALDITYPDRPVYRTSKINGN
ncbi:hypothetical protein C2G38_2061510 [Gigaspora rosea]|uniref:Uncharacterized protein n=1 Tax=Gigaspora rosea TaxID=44941 RepID=A0A397W2V4_9GLOM|nr:hypothetical protein C2G38_2061510 [Gigaspora rosea]